MAWLPVAGAAQLTPGDFIQVDTGNAFVLVCNVNGELLAIEDQCTHDGSSMADGLIDGDQMICPRHGARFCLRTGEAMSPPAYEAVRTFPARINGLNIEVDVPE
jgi:3-phenylpropionate/trans-cinnamate dioxygenase ferredoxin component